MKAEVVRKRLQRKRKW